VNLDTAIIVPGRLASTRFPRKLLHEVGGVPLIVWVARRLAAEAPEYPLWFAVDDAALAAPLRAEGYAVLLTRADHASGTDRLAEANRSIGARHVINAQADEPLVTGSQIRALRALLDGPVAMSTLATPLRTAADWANPNHVKVVVRRDGRALFFSRSRLPYPRDLAGEAGDAWVTAHPCRRHLGLYGYRADLLETFASLPRGELEVIEQLEQLRVLENGHDIAVGLTEDPSIGVDVPADAVKFERWLTGQSLRT
jgi:3-deoxy-manno-octulosonate cytidylyltransferase (CMP-KDO synthetase)